MKSVRILTCVLLLCFGMVFSAAASSVATEVALAPSGWQGGGLVALPGSGADKAAKDSEVLPGPIGVQDVGTITNYAFTASSGTFTTSPWSLVARPA